MENNSIRSIGINYKLSFIDEFQDTDDIQIETILGLQKCLEIIVDYLLLEILNKVFIDLEVLH